jgi:hypothetical protein
MTRSIVQAEALSWLREHPASEATSVITSLPDRSELAGSTFEEWRTWFVDTARSILRWLPAGGVAIFYQTDVRRDERWVDKGYLVLSAAEAESAPLIWHKIVSRQTPGTANPEGRPSYSHLLCVGREARAPRHPTPDVLPGAGAATWSRGMGFAAAQHACDYLRDETSTRCVVDPFCGTASVLAVASTMGFDVVGVELNAKRCRAARTQLARVDAMHAALRCGAILFDRGEFFDAHEAWEARWRATDNDEERRGMQGLIQVAAAFHKLFVMQSPESAQRLLGKGLAKLDATHWLPGVDLSAFRGALRRCEASLAAGNFERSGVPKLLRDAGTADPRQSPR